MRRKNKRAVGVADIKALLFSGSMVAILGFWNMFARQDASKNLDTRQGAVLLPAQSPPGLVLDLPPLPTLLPPLDTDQGQNGTDNDVPVQELRSVDAPTPVPRSSNPIIISGGSRNSGKGSSVTTTSSSR
jgi:hypothetical protein